MYILYGFVVCFIYHVYITPSSAAALHTLNHGVLNELKSLHALCMVSLIGTFKRKLLGAQTDFYSVIVWNRLDLLSHVCSRMHTIDTLTNTKVNTNIIWLSTKVSTQSEHHSWYESCHCMLSPTQSASPTFKDFEELLTLCFTFPLSPCVMISGQLPAKHSGSNPRVDCSNFILRECCFLMSVQQ